MIPLRIGVAGLTVHSGEGGMFGREEIDVIGPAIRKANDEGYAVVGPVPPDSLFPNALQGDYTGLVSRVPRPGQHWAEDSGAGAAGRDPLHGDAYAGSSRFPTEQPTILHGREWPRHAMLARAVTMAAAIVEVLGRMVSSGIKDKILSPRIRPRNVFKIEAVSSLLQPKSR